MTMGLAALASTAAVAALVVVPSATAATPPGPVTGTVFQDFNSNGVMDTAASATGLGGVGVQDVGVKGVTVDAYDDAGAKVGSATTAADGTYSIDTSALAAGTPLRIEFDTPSGYYPAVHGTGAGVTNGTSVQFTTAGSTTAVNYGVENPADVSVTNPPILVTINSQGGWNSPANANKSAWVIQPYDSGNTHAAATVLGTFADVGSVWSTVFAQATNSGYASASLRRDSAMGPLGLGGIYRVGDLTGKNGQLDPAHGSVQQWLDVTSLGIDIGQSKVPSNADRGVDAAANAADADAYQWVGRAGIGGMAVNKAGTELYFADLFNNKVYALALDPSDPSAAPTSYTEIDTPVKAGQQISAVAVHDGQLYIGYVDTGDLTGPKLSATDAGLKAYVASTPVASPGTWTSALDFPLGYAKPANVAGLTSGAAIQWNTWSNTFDVCNNGTSCGTAPHNFDTKNAGWLLYPQAMLSGIAFDSQGFMAIALGDRWELQDGNGNPGSPCLNPDLTASGFTGCTLNGSPAAAGTNTAALLVSGGQTLTAAPQSDGSYELENNGVLSIDGVTARTSAFAASLPTPPAVGVGTGPGGKSFLNSGAIGGPHYAASLGAVTTVPGGAQVVNTSMDPAGVLQSGLDWLNMTNGTANGNYFESTEFAKGGAIGGVTSVIAPVGIEIGNRVWLDRNGNGIQDADTAREPGIPGEVVQLLDSTGKVLATTTTDANGNYYFNSDDIDGFAPNGGKYSVAFVNPSTLPTTDPNYKAPTSQAVPAYVVGGTTIAPAITWGQLQLTAPNVGKDAGINSKAVADTSQPQNGVAPYTAGPPGDNDHTLDAGLTVPPPSVSVGDFVWKDTNGDGIEDAGEPGIPGVVVTLTGPDGKAVTDVHGQPVGPQTTDGSGHYEFTDLPTLPAGEHYTVTIDQTASADALKGLVPTVTGGDSQSHTGSATSTLPLDANGDADNTLDFGFKQGPVSIGDYMWIDKNGNGIQDAGEPPVAGSTVKLLDAAGDVVATTTTDANGYYSFTNLAPDTDYTVQFPTIVIADGINYALTKPDQGTNPALDSNPDQATGDAPVTTPKSGENSGAPGKADNPTIDAGYVAKPVSIGDYLWIDSNGNGIQDAGEPPVAGSTVKLLDAAGDVVATTTTDANGYYSFTNLAPDTDYTVQFPTQVTVDGINYSLTKPEQGGNPALDSNPDQATGDAPVTTPKSGENSGAPGKADNPTIDAGYVANPVSIGDRLWIDKNGNGIQDAGEPAVPDGTVVKLLDAAGDVVATTTTKNGYYAFTNLPPDTKYTVQFPTTVTVDGITYELTTPSAKGSTAANDSNPNPANGLAPVTTPKSGENSGAPGKADNPTIDAGYKPQPVSIGDYVWIDKNGNGIQDAGEPPVAGATVKLLDAAGDVVATTTTDADGYYNFTDLAPGAKYTVQFPTQVTVDGINYSLTKPGQGGNPAKDSNPNQATGLAPVTTPGSGMDLAGHNVADNPTIDAGYVAKPVSIGDYMWIDKNGNGIQDAGEPPVAGATVKLLDAAGDVVATTTTDANGYYSFTNLAPDTDYTVQFPTTVTVDGITYVLTTPNAKGSTAANDSNPNPANGLAPVTTPKSGENSGAPGKADNPTIDAGYVAKPVSIGDYLWIDKNGNGIQDAGEPVVPDGTVVKLLDAAGDVVATTTTTDGYYSFTNLAPDTKYGVQFPTSVTVNGTKYQLTKPGQGEPGTDSTPSQSTGITWLTSPKAGNNLSAPGKADNPTIDAGYVPVAVAPVEINTGLGAEGGQPNWALIGGGVALLLLLAGGAVVLLAERRRRSLR